MLIRTIVSDKWANALCPTKFLYKNVFLETNEITATEHVFLVHQLSTIPEKSCDFTKTIYEQFLKNQFKTKGSSIIFTIM